LQQESELLESFVKFKLRSLKARQSQIVLYLEQKGTDAYKEAESNLRVLFDNLYIETEYLRMLLSTNMETFEKH
jgi:hypothetical protein